MSELTIRRDNMTFTPPNLRAAVKTEKGAAGSEVQKAEVQKPGAEKPGTVNISDTLQELMTRIGQSEGQLRGSRSLLQMGQAVLDEVQDSLNKIAELTKESVEGEEPDREALQGELEKLVEKIDRMLSGASAGDKPLFAEGKAEFIEGVLSGEIDLEEVLQGVRDLLAKLAEGLPPETALGTLDLGSPLLTLLTGIGGMNMDLLMSLLTALESSQTALNPPEGAPANVPGAPAEAAAAAAETETPAAAGAARAADVPTAAAAETKQFGGLLVTGRDLSGVTFDQAANEGTVAGEAEVTVRGTGQGEAPALRLTGSGEVTLQEVKTAILTVETPQAHVTAQGENQLGEVRMEQGAALTVGGEGAVRLDTVQGDGSNLLRLTGSVTVSDGGEREKAEWKVPVVVEGAALLMAHAASVRPAEGKSAEAFDLIWKALLPNMASLTEAEVDGKHLKQSMLNGEHARLWLDKGDPSHGYPLHAVVLRGRDKSGRLQSRYAYLQWSEAKKAFREVAMYPNPFTVTGGEEGLDWVYEEDSQTLRILTAQVTAIAGGQGVDAEENPFSGRVRLADHIALITLVLNGVECRVSSGKAFDLGRDNEVFLTLASGSRNVFESGDGCWGISMGEDSHVNIGYAEGPIGILAATIGADLTPEQPKPEGIPVQVGGGTVTLPQFPLSSKALRLDLLRVSTQEYAQASMTILEADRRWVAQIQAVYRTVHSQLEWSMDGFPGGRMGSGGGLVRDSVSAGQLMEDVKRTIHLKPEVASYLHSRRGKAELHRLLK